MGITNKQIGMVRAILHKHGLGEEEEKTQVIKQLTEGRTEHISEITHQECNRLVVSFQGEDGRDRMVRKILSMAHDMKWELKDGKVDMDRINNWCKLYSPPHVPLDQIKTHELGKVVTIFKKVHTDFMKGI